MRFVLVPLMVLVSACQPPAGPLSDEDWKVLVPLEARGGLLLWRLYRSMGR